MLSTRICSSAAPLVRRMSRFVGSRTRPTVSVASGSGSPAGAFVGSGDEPVQALRMIADAATAEMTAMRLVRRNISLLDPLGAAGSGFATVPGDGGDSDAGLDGGCDELGELGRRRLLDVVGGVDGDEAGSGNAALQLLGVRLADQAADRPPE